MEPRLPPSGDAAHLLPAPSLAQEVEAGGVEYKLMLGTADEARRAHLATQMRWRLREGSGRCVYYIGVMDNGTPVGLRVADAEASLAVLRGMAGDAGAAIESVLWRSAAAPPGDATGAAARRVLEVHLVRAQPQAPGAAGGSRGGSPADASAASRSAEADDAASKVEPRVALLGAQGAGKSSLVAALSQGILDDGNGAARMLVVRHRHELETGVTSSGVSWWTVGLDARGGLLAPSEHDAVSIASAGSEGHDLLAFRGGGGCGSSSYFRGAAARTLALLDLPGSQLQLLQAVLNATGNLANASYLPPEWGALGILPYARPGGPIPVVVVLIHSRPATFDASRGNWLLPGTANTGRSALIAAWQPSEQGGPAIVDVLMGRVNPSGHLAQAWLRSAGHVRSPSNPYLQLPNSQQDGPWFEPYGDTWEPLFPFAHGLSYTTFSASDLRVSPTPGGAPVPADPSGVVNFTVAVNNTGARAGTTLVQVYATQVLVPGLIRFTNRLAGWQRVALGAGEAQDVTVSVALSDLDRWDEASQRWVVDAGNYTFAAGLCWSSAGHYAAESRDFPCQQLSATLVLA